MTRTMRVLVLMVAMLMIAGGLSFAGGGQEEAGSEGMEETNPLEGVDPSGAEVVYWYQHSREREDVLQELIAEFNQTNEWDITVNGEYAGGYGEIYNKMITSLAGGSVPDLVVAYQNQAAAYQVADGLVDLRPYVEHPEYGIGESDMEDFFEGYIRQDLNAQFDGQRLGFPPNRSVELLYYNADWVAELGYDGPPESWEEFAEMAAAATDEEAGTYGYALSTGASNIFAQIISRGGTLQGEGGGYNYDSEEMRESMAFMKDLYEKGHARKIAEQYGDQTDFANQKVLFTMGSSSGLPYYASAIEAGEAGEFEWGVAAPPHTTETPQINVYGASLSVTKSTPEKQLASWLFLRWLTEPEQQARWARASNYFPVRKSVANNLDSYFEENPRYQEAFDILTTSDTRAEPPFAGYDEVRDIAESAFNAIIDGENIDETIASLQTEANEVYEAAGP
ncbi:MAG: ABC transporter substrate-binding protein [Spirochaetota bacterium]